MRKLIVSMNITLDGKMAGPKCELDWHFESWTDEMGDAFCNQLLQADTILLGRVTYEAMAEYWPAKMAQTFLRSEDFAFANMMNSYAKIVFSKTLTVAKWNNSKLIYGNVAEEIKLLKTTKGKDIIVYGSGKLVSALIKSGVVDEYQLWLHPVLLGRGKPLFNNLPKRLDLQLIDVKIFTSGVVLLYYQTNKTHKHETVNKRNKRRILER